MAPMLAKFLYRHWLYTPPQPTASFQGKTIIVTGANSGLGKEATRWLVKLGAHVVMAVRSVDKGNTAASEIRSSTGCAYDKIEVWECDMSSYASLIAFAERAKTQLPRLDAVLCNAGIHHERWGYTEGHEEHLATNVVSTALIACLLHPQLKETSAKFSVDTHLTTTSSDLYNMAKFKERNAPEGQLFEYMNDEKKSDLVDRYNVTKLLEIYTVREMAALAPYHKNSRVIINCVPPGFCESELTRERNTLAIKGAKKVLARPTEVGARTLVLAASASPDSHGQYIEDGVSVVETVGFTKGPEGAKLQRRFWSELRAILEAAKPGVTTFSY